jgi:hypothetical protein
MGRLISLMQAIATHTLPDGYKVNQSPYIQAVWPIRSTTDVANGGGADPTYDDSAYVDQLSNLMDALGVAFPNTSAVISDDGSAGIYSVSQAVVERMRDERMALSGLDVFGFSSGSTYVGGDAGTTVGQAAYIGLFGATVLNWTVPTTNEDGTTLTDLDGFRVYRANAPFTTTAGATLLDTLSSTTIAYTDPTLTPGTYYYGITSLSTSLGESEVSGIGPIIVGDLRGKVPYIARVRSVELGDAIYYTPADIFAQIDSVLQATHAFWEMTSGESGDGNFLGIAPDITTWLTDPATYGGVLYEIVNNPLTHTGYPSGYPS